MGLSRHRRDIAIKVADSLATSLLGCLQDLCEGFVKRCRYHPLRQRRLDAGLGHIRVLRRVGVAHFDAISPRKWSARRRGFLGFSDLLSILPRTCWGEESRVNGCYRPLRSVVSRPMLYMSLFLFCFVHRNVHRKQSYSHLTERLAPPEACCLSLGEKDLWRTQSNHGVGSAVVRRSSSKKRLVIGYRSNLIEAASTTACTARLRNASNREVAAHRLISTS
jgi:hypothetical protein